MTVQFLKVTTEAKR